MGAFDTTVGVLLLGLFFNTYLYGLVTYQFMVYANTSLLMEIKEFKDPMWIKAIVGTLFVTDTLHSAVAVYAGWELCVTNYANPASLAFVSWTIPFTACATSVAAILTQYFLGHRVWILTKNKILVGLIGILSFLGFVFGIYAGVRSGVIRDRSRTGFRKTDTIINRLIRGAIQTGLFASIFALADLFSFVLHGNTNLYAMFAYPIGRIYTNSLFIVAWIDALTKTLLDTLNARVELKLMNTSTMDVEGDTTSNAFRMQTQSRTVAGQTIHSIHVSKETVTQTSPEERSVEKFTGDEDAYGSNKRYDLLSSTRYDDFLLNLKWNNDDDEPSNIFLLRYHFDRLVAAADRHNWEEAKSSLVYHDFKTTCQNVVANINDDRNEGRAFKLRFTLSQTGKLAVTTSPVPPFLSDPTSASFFNPLTDNASLFGSVFSIYLDPGACPSSIFTSTKTTYRPHYEDARRRVNLPPLIHKPMMTEVLLYNEQSFITETSIFNVAVYRASQWLTPSNSTGCLSGVLRRWLLEQGRIHEDKDGQLTKDSIKVGDWVLLFNGVHGCQLGKIVNGIHID
ncbi:hypothetical protein DXG01_009733 [Tephrocybe rancida]|nr:hypothetical protein DXG01_009733 [Tephrocybe rancida]